MLSSFIRWKGRRKRSGVHESCSHPKSPSPSPSSVPSPVVFDINEASIPPSTTRTPVLAELDLPGSCENWFPPELLGSRNCTHRSSLYRSKSVRVAQRNSAQVTRASSSPLSSTGRSRRTSPRTISRKKSAPAPIVIPDADPNIQIGRSAITPVVSVAEASQSNTNGALLSPPSPSASDSLSVGSGVSLTRALMASTFLLLSSERHRSRHRNGVARQDSATLPGREPVFASDVIPPVPSMSVNVPSNPVHSPTIMSRASTESEYPTSDACMTPPGIVISADTPQRMSRTQEIPSQAAYTSPSALPSATSDVEPERTNIGSACTRAIEGANFDVPKTAVEMALPISPPRIMRRLSREGSSALSSDEHSLDEFDFVPPEPLVVIASPGLDSSDSYTPPLPKCSDTKRRRRAGRLPFIQSGFMKDRSDITPVLHQGCGISSRTMPEHDYGDLLNYDMTFSSDSSSSSYTPSSGSTGHQTLPETPMAFSPFWSPVYSLLAKGDSRMLHGYPLAPRSAGLATEMLHPSTRAAGRRQVDNNCGILRRSRSSLLPRRETPLFAPPKFSLLVCTQVMEEEVESDESDLPSSSNATESGNHVDVQASVRPHPLAHISTSSSCLPEEEALRALARHSSLFLSPMFIGDVGTPPYTAPLASPVIDSFTEPLASIPAADSSNDSHPTLPLMAAPSSASPLQSSPSLTATAVTQRDPSKSLSLAPCSIFGESYLHHPSVLAPLDEQLSPSPTAVVSTPLSDESDESISPSLFPPPPYHAVVSERTAYYPGSHVPHSLSPKPSSDQYHRDISDSLIMSGSIRDRGRIRPRPPIGPRQPSGAGDLGSHSRDGSVSSLESCDLGPLGLPWRKLQRAASMPPPRFQTPPPKWRGLTLEAAQWTFTSAQLQAVVSRAIQQSSDGSFIRLLRPEVLEGEIADEMHRLELEHTDVKAQYKTLARKRWALMGALAGQIEGGETHDASHGVESLAEILLALDSLAERIHGIVLRMAQLQSLRDVHSASALALAIRKINGVFVRQMTEKERLQEHVDALTTERDEAWRHAEDVAKDYDTLNECMLDKHADGELKVNGDVRSSPATSLGAPKRLARVSAVRKSSARLSQAGLRPRSRHRPGPRSSGDTPRPESLILSDEFMLPLPRLPLHCSLEGPASPTGASLALGSRTYSLPSPTSNAPTLAAVQRDVYEMLGLSVSPSRSSSGWSVGHRPVSTLSTSMPDSVDINTPAVGSRTRSASESLHLRGTCCLKKRVERTTRPRSAILDRSRVIGAM